MLSIRQLSLLRVATFHMVTGAPLDADTPALIYRSACLVVPCVADGASTDLSTHLVDPQEGQICVRHGSAPAKVQACKRALK